MKRGKKIHLLENVRKCVESGNFFDTFHSAARQCERNITRPEIVFVLKNGRHEEVKDKYDGRYCAWNYAIRGYTIDGRELRVIVSFEGDDLLIITAIELDA